MLDENFVAVTINDAKDSNLLFNDMTNLLVAKLLDVFLYLVQLSINYLGSKVEYLTIDQDNQHFCVF